MDRPSHPDMTRILVVEDDPGSRDALQALLEDAGYDVDIAGNGIEALQCLAEHPADLILSDVVMPGSDGFDLAVRLRRISTARHVPLILVSAIDEPGRRALGLDIGADDFMLKPVDADELLARVRMHLRRARREAELRERSITDELTGLLNRRGILEELERERARALRNGTPLSVLAIDVDGFKAINDTYGHAAGDAVLVHVARTVERTVRTTDRVGRMGGDELLVILPDTDQAPARALAARLDPVQGGPLGTPIGLSIGTATLAGGEPIGRLVTRADRAMYTEKRRRHGLGPASAPKCA